MLWRKFQLGKSQQYIVLIFMIASVFLAITIYSKDGDECSCNRKLRINKNTKRLKNFEGRYVKKLQDSPSLNGNSTIIEGKTFGEEGQYRRQIQLRKFCLSQRKHMLYNPVIHRQKNMWYNDEHGIVYCYVPKAACTNWKRVMQTLRGTVNDDQMDINNKESIHDLSHPNFSKMKSRDINKRINTYFSFMFVRHPFARLVSAYRNKFEDPYNNYFRKTYGMRILKKYRPGMDPEKIILGEDVKFHEFVKYILDIGNSGKLMHLNEHWQIMGQLCHPCHIKYSFIGKMETLHEDAELVLKFIGIDHSFQFPYKLRDKYSKPAEQHIRKYMQELKNDTIDQLLKLYKNDFDAFEYEMNESWRPGTHPNISYV